MLRSDWTANQKKLIQYYDPERYEKIWGVKEVVKEVAAEPVVKEEETKKEDVPAAE